MGPSKAGRHELPLELTVTGESDVEEPVIGMVEDVAGASRSVGIEVEHGSRPVIARDPAGEVGG